jgi:hypothetical protein
VISHRQRRRNRYWNGDPSSRCWLHLFHEARPNPNSVAVSPLMLNGGSRNWQCFFQTPLAADPTVFGNLKAIMSILIHCSLSVAFLVGISCVLFSKQIQLFGVTQYKTWFGVPNPFLDWMKTSGYIFVLRVIGCVLVFMSVISEIVILGSKR